MPSVDELISRINLPGGEPSGTEFFRTPRVKELLNRSFDRATGERRQRTSSAIASNQPAGGPQTFGFGAQSSSGGDDPSTIYQTLRSVGFDPQTAETWTAIGLAESGGRRDAHNSRGEDSRGWFQINMDAHADKFAGWDLSDPVQNARAAFIVSNGGTNMRPWTVTHSDRGAPFRKFLGTARQARERFGE